MRGNPGNLYTRDTYTAVARSLVMVDFVVKLREAVMMHIEVMVAPMI